MLNYYNFEIFNTKMIIIIIMYGNDFALHTTQCFKFILYCVTLFAP